MADPLEHARPVEKPEEASARHAAREEYHAFRFKRASKRLLPAAIAGERWAVLRILSHVSDAIADHCHLPPDIAKWLAPKLHRLSCGDTIEKAFAIPKRKRGEAQEDSAAEAFLRGYLIAYHVEYITVVEKQKQLYAFARVAEQAGLTQDAVKKAYRKYRAEASQDIRDDIATVGKAMLIPFPRDLLDLPDKVPYRHSHVQHAPKRAKEGLGDANTATAAKRKGPRRI